MTDGPGSDGDAFEPASRTASSSHNFRTTAWLHADGGFMHRFQRNQFGGRGWSDHQDKLFFFGASA
jgi:hypothetical protein